MESFPCKSTDETNTDRGRQVVAAVAAPTLAPASIAQPAPIVRTSHPIGFWFLFWGEFAERCSFYGMKAILLLYLIDRLGLERGVASAWINYFKAACYFLPLAG